MDDPYAAQKEQCIFCKIIKGDVPGKKVYEDEHVLAILDINPARKGHLLVMPKEHYPLLPVVPFDVQQHLFEKTHGIIKALKEAMLVPWVSVFVANGAVAGQQSPHFLFHLIPREEGDLFDVFTLPQSVEEEKNNLLLSSVQTPINQMLNAYLHETNQVNLMLAKEPEPEESLVDVQPPQPIEQTKEPKKTLPPLKEGATLDERLEYLIELLDVNEDLRDALIERPEEIKEAAKTVPKFIHLFEGVDIDQLSENLKIMLAAHIKEDTDEDEGK